MAIIAKTPTLEYETPPLHFPSSDLTFEHFPNNSTTSTIPKPYIIDSTTPNPLHSRSSHQTSLASQNLDTNILQNFPLNHHIPTQIVQSPPTTQQKPLKTTFYLPILPELYTHLTTYFAQEHFETKENDWMFRKVKT